jgi:nitrite reductase (NADH) large subunit
LIVLGEVARDFGLYTKITGGQRIDLFGAQLHSCRLSGAAWSTRF